ncbi:hypothetical protein BO83DRAFT_410787 [Aspergillus eucalypticola CBS 122712]|uniref:Uncharacterized protein n=1 Tax=Aspergillus eucalypticola (strain CBS 122712 / IBT 29274) TaxID=1448314 RepID=A0A317UWT0_ASPEC|nr:uncharacterized protein BO83DRAFT_410787 [Aspergillus eucalypticola CBS 122712]PWY65869.1 hypothetical protein BO83DRAFT_410787 [Aspergillus eucalypticola CBS 122712]
MSVDVAMQSSGKTVATSAYSIMQPLGGRQDPGSSCQDDPFGCVVVVSGETAKRARLLGAAAMKPGNKLDRENITDGEREAGAYKQAVVQKTRTGMTWLMRGSNPVPPPNRNDMPISGRMSGLGPSVEDAPWRGSATVPPSSKVYYYYYYNLGGKSPGKVKPIAPWMGENRSNNPVGQRHGEKSRRFRQSNIVHPVQ